MTTNQPGKTQAATLVSVIMLLIVPTIAEATERTHTPTTLTFEAAYFHPRRAKFRDFYGSGLPALSLRLDTKFRGTTSLSIKVRGVQMQNFQEIKFTNLTAGFLLKKELRTLGRASFYIAAGPQFEVRLIKADSRRRVSFFDVIIDQTQTDLMPSLALEGGVDLWLSGGFKVSPHITFNYFPPFVDPTRGNFGDTGGFDLALGVGFRL